MQTHDVGEACASGPIDQDLNRSPGPKPLVRLSGAAKSSRSLTLQLGPLLARQFAIATLLVATQVI